MAKYSLVEMLKSGGPLSHADIMRTTGLAEVTAQRAISECVSDGLIASAGDNRYYVPLWDEIDDASTSSLGPMMRSLARRWDLWGGYVTRSKATGYPTHHGPPLSAIERRALLGHIGGRLVALERAHDSHEPFMDRAVVVLGEELGLGLSDSLGQLIDLALGGDDPTGTHGAAADLARVGLDRQIVSPLGADRVKSPF